MRFSSSTSCSSLANITRVSSRRAPTLIQRVRFPVQQQLFRVTSAALFSTTSGAHNGSHNSSILIPHHFNRSCSELNRRSLTSSTCIQQQTRAPFSSSASNTDESKPKKETETGAEHYEFLAETRQLLDIVTHSLYTDREVFLRELISNASDACEKLRHIQAANEAKTIDADLPLEIHVKTNEADQTLTISDTGIGMTKDEMIKNLGTIGRSGSKAFVHSLKKKSAEDPVDVTGASQGIIGRFGVGFYSSFMVGKSVDVRSR